MVLRHSAIYMVSRGTPGLIGFATVVVYTRMLSPEGYGQYALVVTTAILANAILYHWLNGSLLRFLPRCQDNQADLLVSVLAVFAAICLVSGVGAALLAAPWRSVQWHQLLLLSVALVWAQAWFTINLELMRSRLMPVRYGVVSSLRAVLALGLGALLIWWQPGTWDAATGAVTGLIVTYLVAGLLAAKGQWTAVGEGTFNPALIRELLAYGLPLTASLALNAVVNGTDRFMLAGMIDEAATGLYVAGQGLAQQSVGVLLMMINLAAYPLAVRAFEHNGAEAVQIQLRKNVLLLLAMGLPATSMFIILAPEISTLLLGSAFQESGTVLMPWFAVAAMLSGLRAYYFDLAFYLGRRTHMHVLVMIMAALVNVVLNVVLIPRLGLPGAAYASVAAFAVALAFSVMLGRRALSMPWPGLDAGKLLLATLVMCGVLFVVPHGQGVGQLALALVTAIAAYALCVVLMNTGDARTTLVRAWSLQPLKEQPGK